MCACKARMQPVGLTLKKSRKKYGLAKYGELMLIHMCEDCGNISINRVAADDDATRLMEIYHHSLTLEGSLQARLKREEIQILAAEDVNILSARLFGK